jgi:tetratricopeptide (TPR) repeat protein
VRERLLQLDWGVSCPGGWAGESKECCEEAIEVTPAGNDGTGRTAVGLAASGDFAEALARFEKISVARPGDARNLVNVAGCLRALGRPEEALQKYTEALVADPADVLCALNKARCLEALGRDEEALLCCEKALELHMDVQGQDARNIEGLRQSLDGAEQNLYEAKRYIKLLEEEEGKKGGELERAGEYTRKLEQLIADQAAALAAVKQAGAPQTQGEQQEPGLFGSFKMHMRDEGLPATIKRSLAYAAKKLKRR